MFLKDWIIKSNVFLGIFLFRKNFDFLNILIEGFKFLFLGFLVVFVLRIGDFCLVLIVKSLLCNDVSLVCDFIVWGFFFVILVLLLFLLVLGVFFIIGVVEVRFFINL